MSNKALPGEPDNKAPNSLVSIIVLNWNGRAFLQECLQSLVKTRYEPFNVIVVDNGSTDGSPEMVKRDFPSVDLLEMGRNLGYPAGNNRGISYAMQKYHPDHVMLLNNDTRVIDPDWLEHLVRAAESDSSVGIAGCLLVSPDGSAQRVGLEILPGVHLPFFYRTMRYPGIGCSLIKRSVIERVGLFDEGYYRILFEDVDYRKRAQNEGFEVKLEPRSLLLHYGSATTRQRPSLEMLYVFRRNGTRYVKKYHPQMLFLFIAISYVGCLALLRDSSTGFRVDKLRAAFSGTTKGIAHGLVT